jgi:MAF protein
LVLASASPRRQALVALLGLPWRVAPADIAEEDYLLTEPTAAAVNVAVAKALAVTANPDDEIVVAADTLVVIDDDILAKPADPEAAREMLDRLRGRAHHVLTGVLVRSAELSWAGVVDTRVVMRNYAVAEIDAYIARGEPFDKAGGYAVQDAAFRPVERLEGCYLNVVGLPLCAVAAGLNASGVGVQVAGPPPCTYCKRGAPLVRLGQ